MNIYLDACCVNRPFDDQQQKKIRLESEAITLLLEEIQSGKYRWIGSDVLQYGLEQTPDLGRRSRILASTQNVQQIIVHGEKEVELAKLYSQHGIKSFDALHLACAQSSNVALFFTTDKRLLGQAHRIRYLLNFQVVNPLQWINKDD